MSDGRSIVCMTRRGVGSGVRLASTSDDGSMVFGFPGPIQQTARTAARYDVGSTALAIAMISAYKLQCAVSDRSQSAKLWLFTHRLPCRLDHYTANTANHAGLKYLALRCTSLHSLRNHSTTAIISQRRISSSTITYRAKSNSFCCASILYSFNAHLYPFYHVRI